MNRCCLCPGFAEADGLLCDECAERLDRAAAERYAEKHRIVLIVLNRRTTRRFQRDRTKREVARNKRLRAERLATIDPIDIHNGVYDRDGNFQLF